ncbi:MAG TPA: hypothetical protein VJX74_08315 [Blastocatellia bacterium]|nr:hypothetical protein [Blastocatellia bacterium]
MKIRATRLSLALMLALTVSPIVSAQDSLQDWGVVQALTAGTELIIETKTPETIKGKLSNVTDTTLNLSRDGKSVALDQQQIHRVYLVDKRSRKRSALRGAAKGALIGARTASEGKYVYWTSPKSLLFGGAVVGAVIESRNRKGQLIYESK